MLISNAVQAFGVSFSLFILRELLLKFSSAEVNPLTTALLAWNVL